MPVAEVALGGRAGGDDRARSRPAARCRARTRGWRGPRSSLAEGSRCAPAARSASSRARPGTPRARAAARRRGRGGRGPSRRGVGARSRAARRRAPRAAVGRHADLTRRAAPPPTPAARPRAPGTLDVGVAEAALAGWRRPAGAVYAAGSSTIAQAGIERPPPPRPSRSAHRRVCVGLVVDVVELADGAVAGGRHLAVRAARRRRASSRGRGARRGRTSPRASSRSRRPARSARSPRPRRSRWKACEWRSPSPGSRRLIGAAPRAGRLSTPTDGGVLELHVSSGRVAHAGRVAHEHHRGRPLGGEHAGVVARVAVELGRAGPSACSALAQLVGRTPSPSDHATVRRSSPTPASPAASSRRAVATARATRRPPRPSGARASSHSAAARRHGGERVRLDHQPRRGEACPALLGLGAARTISRAAAASASRRSLGRRGAGVVGAAASARPQRASGRRARARPLRAAPAAARSAIWSMCSSRKPRRRSSRLGASRRRSGVHARLGHRVPERDALVVGRSSAASRRAARPARGSRTWAC